jgi:hypothetical protein
MATIKKTPAKQTSVKKKPTKSTKKTVKKVSRKATKHVLLQSGGTFKSFKLGKNPPFFRMQVTKQTVYWSILLIFILIMQLWILNTQLDVIQSLNNLTAIK